jgi:hypothetical protein
LDYPKIQAHANKRLPHKELMAEEKSLLCLSLMVRALPSLHTMITTSPPAYLYDFDSLLLYGQRWTGRQRDGLGSINLFLGRLQADGTLQQGGGINGLIYRGPAPARPQ